jgi:hypothetical protein
MTDINDLVRQRQLQEQRDREADKAERDKKARELEVLLNSYPE